MKTFDWLGGYSGSTPLSRDLAGKFENQIVSGYNNMRKRFNNRESSGSRKRQRQRYGEQGSRTRQGKRAIVPLSNTTQHDSRDRYSYRRMPGRRRRKWVSAVKRNRAMDIAMQPLQIYTLVGNRTITAAVNQGATWGKILGGTQIAGATGDANNELLGVFQDAYNITTDVQCIPYKIYMKSLCLDIEVNNSGTDIVVCDVYLLKCKGRHNVAASVHTHWQNSLPTTQPASGATALLPSNNALTPFDAPDFCSIWKVLNKKEYIISSGQIATFQMRSPVNKYIDGRRMVDCLQALPGYSMAYLFSFHGQPGADAGGANTPGTLAGELTFSWQMVAHYAVPPGSIQTERGGQHT